MTDAIQMAVLSTIAISCGLLSPFLVLKRMTMFANSLSHTVLVGIAIAFLITGGAVFDLSHLVLGAFLAALLTAGCTEVFVRILKLQEDVGIGLVFTFLFASGIALVTVYMRNVHLGLEAVMGNADVLRMSDLRLCVVVALISASLIVLFYKRLVLVSFDLNLARSLGVNAGIYRALLLFLTALVCVGAFRAVGMLLVLVYLTGPFLIARLFFHRLKPLLIATPLVGVLLSIAAVGISRFCLDVFDLPLSTGALLASLTGLAYAVLSKKKALATF